MSATPTNIYIQFIFLYMSIFIYLYLDTDRGAYTQDLNHTGWAKYDFYAKSFMNIVLVTTIF